MSELQNEMMNLADEAQLLLMNMRLDPTQATDMLRRLFNCADRAHEAGYLFGERELRRAALNLQKRLQSPI